MVVVLKHGVVSRWATIIPMDGEQVRCGLVCDGHRQRRGSCDQLPMDADVEDTRLP